MPVNVPLDDDLSNALWLQSRHALEQVRAAEDAGRRMDELVRAALETGSDAETIADASFVDVDLVQLIASGGTTFHYLRPGEPT
jgi:hypothetical protein